MSRRDSNGFAVAAFLAGAWRTSPPKIELPVTDLMQIVPLLLRSGAGALAWWRIRHSDYDLPPVALQQLRMAYLGHAAQAVQHETEIINAFHALRSSGIEPILIKGWAIARAYAEIGLRPCGDIDLCVSPDQCVRARTLLNARQLFSFPIDLDHDTLRRFGECSFERIYSRSELVKVRSSEIRVPCPEDHLRILCLHLLKHGAWRPLWLCDIAAALESRPQSFDWDLCLAKDRRQSDWVLFSVLLAHHLLEADIGDVKTGIKSRTLPCWLVKSVLKQWNTSWAENLPKFADQVAGHLWTMETLKAIQRRWPNPIQATVDAGGSFRASTRLQYQIRDCTSRAIKLCRQLPQLLHRIN